MSLKAFQISGDELTESDHAKCLHECDKTSGDMLKCQNYNPVGEMPCGSLVHTSCLQNFEAALLPYLPTFFCSECCSSSSRIHEEMIRNVNEARQALARSQNASFDPQAEIKKLTLAVKTLERQLNMTSTQLQAQLALNDTMERRMEAAEAERDKLKAKYVRFPHPSTSLTKSMSDTAIKDSQEENLTDSLLTVSNDTINNAFQINRKAQEKLVKMRSKMNTSSPAINSDPLHDDFSFNSSWPDYEAQELKANAMPEMSLSLLRSSIAKPQPFQGDVTTWAIFLSEFKRTSSRGHYRAVEDMDRLRELIKGEALDMFATELADPYAEPTQVLHRLDEFYGVRGSAVRVSLDRILSLSKVEKPSDKNQLKSLYVNAKSFAHQCRANKKDSELTSQAVIYILESKMHLEHAKAWRIWARENHREESVDGIISFLEERIRELNIMPQKAKISSAVHFTDVTGGQVAPSTSSQPVERTSQKQDIDKNSDRDRRRQKRQKRLEKIECFKCKEHHPFWKCPILIKASDANRLQIVNQLRICHRCLSSTKHEASNCPNKLLQCRVPDCTAVNKHPLLHGHPPDKIKRFTEIGNRTQRN